MNVSEASNHKIIEFPKIIDERGNLTFMENGHYIPFDIKRVFWTYDVPGGETRGAHAYKEQHEVIIALSGSFDVVVTSADGQTEKIQLNRSYYGLYLPPMTWRHMENFSTNALSFHISSHEYRESDYVRDITSFLRLTK